MATPRGRSSLHQSHNSRKSSVLSTSSSVLYHKRIECQRWSEQIEAKVVSLAVSDNLEQRTSLDIQELNNCYPVKNQCIINEAPALNNTYYLTISIGLWNLTLGMVSSISIFGTMEFMEINAKNIYTSLLCMADFIRSRKVDISVINRDQELKEFGDAAFNFISSIYEANWNTIHFDENNNSLRSRITNKFTPKVQKSTKLSKSDSFKNEQADRNC